ACARPLGVRRQTAKPLCGGSLATSLVSSPLRKALASCPWKRSRAQEPRSNQPAPDLSASYSADAVVVMTSRKAFLPPLLQPRASPRSPLQRRAFSRTALQE